MSSSTLSNAQVTDVYRQYGHLLLRRCRAILRNDTLAEDALQEVFVRIMKYGAGLSSADSPLRWLYRVTDRCCFDQLSRQKRVVQIREQLPAPPVGRPATQLEVRDAVLRFLHRLPDRDRAIAVLSFLDGLSQAEIATELGLTRQTINSHLQRIRDRAQKRLAEAR